MSGSNDKLAWIMHRHLREIIEIASFFLLPAVGAGIVAWFVHNKLKRSGNKYPRLIGAGIFLACYVLIIAATLWVIISRIRLER